MNAVGEAKWAYELCIAPSEEAPHAPLKLALLTNSAISSTHWLSTSCGQVNLLSQDAQSFIESPIRPAQSLC